MTNLATEWLDQHLRAHGIKYLWTLIAAFVTGVWLNGWALQWFDGRVIDVATAQITQQTAPIQKKVNEIEQKVEQTNTGLKELLERNYATEIREITALLCSSPGDRRLLAQLEEMQEKYEKLHGDRYVTPSCEVLKRAK